MRGLTVIVAGTEPGRFRAATRIAASAAALAFPTRLFLDEAAVPLARGPGMAGEDGALLNTCLELGVSVTVCQSGLATAGITMAELDPRLVAGGLTGLLASLGDDRLVTL